MIQKKLDLTKLQGQVPNGPVYKRGNGAAAYTRYGNEVLKITDGRVEDPAILDQITRFAWTLYVIFFFKIVFFQNDTQYHPVSNYLNKCKNRKA